MPISKKSAPIAGMIFLGFAYLAFAQVQEEKQPSDGGQTIRVQVDMVSLPVVVTGRNGEYITDLKRKFPDL